MPSKYTVQANLHLTIKCREPPPLEGRSSRVRGNKRNGGASKASNRQNLSNHPTTRGSAGQFPLSADKGDLAVTVREELPSPCVVGEWARTGVSQPHSPPRCET